MGKANDGEGKRWRDISKIDIRVGASRMTQLSWQKYVVVVVPHLVEFLGAKGKLGRCRGMWRVEMWSGGGLQ